jgi:hypothetical protein
MTADRLLAPQPTDVELASLLASLNKKPLTYRDDETGELDSTVGIRGASLVLIIDHVVDLQDIRDSIRQVAKLGGEITVALCRKKSTEEELEELAKLGVLDVRTV